MRIFAKLQKLIKPKDALSDLYSIFKNSPEGHWIIGPNDAQALYELIKKHRPKKILELGSGIGASTAVMALAARDSRIAALEQFEKCLNLARKLIPPDLLRNIKFIHSETEAFKDDRISRYLYFSAYRKLPEDLGMFDFVVIDGPGLWIEEGQLVKLPNGDLIRLLPHIATGGKIYIDGRKQAVSLYKRFLRPYLKVLEENKKSILLERTDKKLQSLAELEVFDYDLEEKRKQGYFNNL